MIFGDPYRFALWVEYIPQWSNDSFKNGFFGFFIDGNRYPHDARTSTLFVDIDDVLDEHNALNSWPENADIFAQPTKEAFKCLSQLAWPVSIEDDYDPEGITDYTIPVTIVNESGAYFFAVANPSSVRIIGGNISQLVENKDNGRNEWQDIQNPHLEDIMLTKSEMSEIIAGLKAFSAELFPKQ